MFIDFKIPFFRLSVSIEPHSYLLTVPQRNNSRTFQLFERNGYLKILIECAWEYGGCGGGGYGSFPLITFDF